MRIRHSFWILLVAILALCLIPSCVSDPTASNQWVRGDRLSEPVGNLSALTVRKETLTFDWTSLSGQDTSKPESRRQGQLTATYQIRNPGDPVTVSFTLASPGAKRSKVKLDNQAILPQPAPLPDVPNPLTQSVSIPTFSDRGERDRSIDRVNPNRWYDLLARLSQSSTRRKVATLYDLEQISPPKIPDTGTNFTMTVPGGDHILTLTYRMRPYEHHGNHVYKDYVIGYLFAPDPSWQSTGRIDLEVIVPRNWDMVSSLSMLRRDQVIWATYLDYPADGMAIAFRYHLNPFAMLTSLALRLGGAILGWMSAYRIGQQFGQSNRVGRFKTQSNVERLIKLNGLACLAFLLPALAGTWLSYELLSSEFISTVWMQHYVVRHTLLLLIGTAMSCAIASIATTNSASHPEI
ncbi:MAG TPA: hypothetical protein ACFE0H_09160 [Elainellaceae cyanobacterium]